MNTVLAPENLRDVATALYGATRHGTEFERADLVDLVREPIVDGGLALDVGGRTGQYIPLIYAMGADSVVLVDPDEAAVQTGIEQRSVAAEDTFVGTLESWVDDVPATKARAAFVFNILPSLVTRGGFWRAIVESVEPGGLLAVSSTEPAVALSAHTMASRIRSLQELDIAPLPVARRSAAGFYTVHFWQRQPHM
jgi:ribosomal protein L11 methylase PrmA